MTVDSAHPEGPSACPATTNHRASSGVHRARASRQATGAPKSGSATAHLPPSEPIEVDIACIVGDGKGIAFHDGKTVFVPETAPGDRVRNRCAQRGKVIRPSC